MKAEEVKFKLIASPVRAREYEFKPQKDMDQ